MKIALVAPFEETVPPKKYGGTELVVYNLAEELVKLGHNVTLLASGDSRTSAKLVSCVPRAIRKFKEAQNARINAAYTYGGLVEAIDVLHTKRFDIVHNHMGWPFFAIKSCVRAPLITTLHNSLKDEYARSHEEKHMYGLYKGTPLVSISKSQRKPFPEFNFIGTVYNGIQVERFSFNAKPDDYLLFFGRFSPEKGPLEAIDIARKTGHRLIMAGKINDFEKEYFNKILKPHIDGKQINFVGEVGHTTKVKLFKNARAVVAPLRWDEPFGLVNIEAMACGTPVITINRGSSPEIIIDGKVGYLCNNVRQMIKRVGDIDKIDRAACRQHVEQHFTAKQMAEAYLKIYQKIIKA